MQAIGARIRYLRENMGATITEVARATGVSKSNICSFENNKSKPSADALVRLSNYFQVTSDWILKGDDVPKKELSILQSNGSPPGPGCARLEYLNPYELELIQNYRKLTERDQGKVDQFVNSLPARIMEESEADKETA